MSGTAKLYLTWDDFDEAVAAIAKRAKQVTAEAVYGIPRGGLPLAVAVSHYAGLPLIEECPIICVPRILMLDDIADTGRTFEGWRHWPHELLACWWRRERSSIPVWSVRLDGSGAWLVFPWERPEAAEAEAADYERRRNDPGE